LSAKSRVQLRHFQGFDGWRASCRAAIIAARLERRRSAPRERHRWHCLPHTGCFGPKRRDAPRNSAAIPRCAACCRRSREATTNWLPADICRRAARSRPRLARNRQAPMLPRQGYSCDKSTCASAPLDVRRFFGVYCPGAPRPCGNGTTRSSLPATRSRISRIAFARAGSWNGLRKMMNCDSLACTTSLYPLASRTGICG